MEDEVLVAFENGDVNRPYIIGSLWNGQDLPPETNKDGKNNIRLFKSRSGHVLQFADTKGGREHHAYLRQGPRNQAG
ncbi:phage baseplate assembly protein V [Paenibacillus rhizoplanae]